MLQYRKATKWTPNAFSNLILFKPILGFLRAWLMIFKHLGLQWLQLGIWYPLILFTKLLYNNCSPFHMSDPWLLVFTKAVPKPVPAGRLWHSLQSDSLPVLFRSGRGALTISRLHKAETRLARGCKRSWHSKGNAKQWREKPSLKSRRLKHTGGGKGCLWPPVLFWHAGLSGKMKFKYYLCLLSWHAPDLQSLADRGK